MSGSASVAGALRGAMLQLWGLFVEDASFTVGIVVCIAIAIVVLPRLAIPATWRGGILFVILALILLENVRRSARKGIA